MNPRGNVDVWALEGRERWYKFPKIISSSVLICFGKFYFLPPSVSSKGLQCPLDVGVKKAGPQQSSVGWEGLLPWKTPQRTLALAGPEISQCCISNGAWNFWLGQEKGSGFTTQPCPPLMSSGWLGNYGEMTGWAVESDFTSGTFYSHELICTS